VLYQFQKSLGFQVGDRTDCASADPSVADQPDNPTGISDPVAQMAGHDLITYLNGELELTTKANVGTRFRVVLPL